MFINNSFTIYPNMHNQNLCKPDSKKMLFHTFCGIIKRKATIYVEKVFNMVKLQICLNSIDKVKDFVNTITNFPENFDLIHDRHIVDAKSILGILSLDLTKELQLAIHMDPKMDSDTQNARVELIKNSICAYLCK